MLRASLKKWIASLPYSVPVGWILLHLVTVRWQEGPDTPFPELGQSSPQWGFPLPWAWWPAVSSLDWDLSILALLADLTVYSVAVAVAGELIRSRIPPISKWPRRAAYAVLLVLSGWVGLFWCFGLVTGGHSVVLLLSTERVTRVSICFASDCYLPY